MKRLEPERLRRGKAFHDDVQEEWEADAEGDVTCEKGITKPGGKRGRMDIHVQADDELSAVVEIKNSDWDDMAPERVRPNAKRYARQIWTYIESQLELGQHVSPGIIFPKRPNTPGRLDEIERVFDEEGIPVVWQDVGNRERQLSQA